MDMTFAKALMAAVATVCVCAGSADAVTRTAASCSAAAVGAAINAAVDGDTVVIPAGTCSWTSNVTIMNKILTLQGAGIDQTIIIDNVPRTNGYPQMLNWTTKDGGITRITGITFQGGTTPDGFNSGIVTINGVSHQLRIDNCKFVPTQTSGLMLSGYLWGVVDHNTFDVSSGTGYGLYIFHNVWNVPGSDFGDASWADVTDMGTSRAMFVEDNTFTNDQSVWFHNYANDGWSGGRVVYRHNTYANTTWANHGTESSGRWRSQRQFEVYDNTFTFNLRGNAFPSLIASRGGVGVVYNNTATVTNGSVDVIADLQYYRSGQAFDPWGQCNGSSTWDQNSNSTGYKCLDQPGVGRGDLLANFNASPVGWPHQASDPTYAWNNRINGSLSNMVSNVPSAVVANRDFFNSSRPGYTPYVYPHPLVTPTVAPSAPQNLVVQ